MEDMIKIIGEYGVTLIIVALFIYAWLDDRKNRTEMLDKSLTLEKNNNEILSEMKKTNENMAKTLELLQLSLQNQTELLKSHDEEQKEMAKEVQNISLKIK